MEKIGIKAVIVDDDQTSRLILKSQLVDNINPGFRIIGSAGTVAGSGCFN